MSTPETPPIPPQAATPAGVKQKLYQWVSIAVGVILLLTGALRAYNAFFPSLPECSSETAKTTIGQIFKDKKVELSTLTNQKSVSDGSEEKTCQAEFTTPAEAGTLSYRIYWQGKEAEVRITAVDAHQR